MELSENIITKLFDTLRKSIDDLDKSNEKTVDAQINTMGYLKPKIEKIEENTKENLELTKGLLKKVSTMIIVVLVAFTLMTSAYFIARGLHDLSDSKKYNIEQIK